MLERGAHPWKRGVEDAEEEKKQQVLGQTDPMTGKPSACPSRAAVHTPLPRWAHPLPLLPATWEKRQRVVLKQLRAVTVCGPTGQDTSPGKPWPGQLSSESTGLGCRAEWDQVDGLRISPIPLLPGHRSSVLQHDISLALARSP